MCPSLRVRALILAAELQCCCAAANSAPAGSVSLLTTALALSHLHYLDYLAALAALHLANVQVGRLAKECQECIVVVCVHHFIGLF